MSSREIVELVRACGRRACSSEEHWDCPFGNESMTDCFERLGDAYDSVIDKLLALEDEVHGSCKLCAERMSIDGKCGECKYFAQEAEGDFWRLKDLTGGKA